MHCQGLHQCGLYPYLLKYHNQDPADRAFVSGNLVWYAALRGWYVLASCSGMVLQEGAIQDLDAYYEKLGNFTGIYARNAFDRMAKTVPKAIILCQVGAG